MTHNTFFKPRFELYLSITGAPLGMWWLFLQRAGPVNLLYFLAYNVVALAAGLVHGQGSLTRILVAQIHLR